MLFAIPILWISASMDGIEVVKQEIKEIDMKLNDHLMQWFYLLSAHPMFSTTPSPVDIHTGLTPLKLLFKGLSQKSIQTKYKK